MIPGREIPQAMPGRATPRPIDRFHPPGPFGSLLLAGLLATTVTAAPGFADDEPPPPVPRNQTYEDYARQTTAALPTYDESILAVATGPNWMDGKTVHDIAQAAADIDPSHSVAQGAIVIGYDEPDGVRMIKLDFSRGYARYANRERAFREGIPCGAVSPSVARATFDNLVGALGLPRTEMGALSIDTAMERAVDGEEADPPESSCEIERMVTQGRRAGNGLPVFDGWARTSLSNLGEIARITVRWPQFDLAPGLAMRTRTEVIEDMTRRIWEAEADDNGLGPELEVHVELGYLRTLEGHVPVAKVGWSDIHDRDAGLIEAVPLARNPTSGGIPGTEVPGVQLRTLYDPSGRIAILEFYLPTPETVRLTIYDAAGRQVNVVTEGRYAVGWQRLEWDLRDGQGQAVPSGVYFARLQAGRVSPTQKVLVVR